VVPSKGEEPATGLLKLSATGLHLSRHLRMEARRRCSTSAAEAA